MKPGSSGRISKHRDFALREGDADTLRSNCRLKLQINWNFNRTTQSILPRHGNLKVVHSSARYKFGLAANAVQLRLSGIFIFYTSYCKH